MYEYTHTHTLYIYTTRVYVTCHESIHAECHESIATREREREREREGERATHVYMAGTQWRVQCIALCSA